MRVSKEQAEKNRKRVVETAGALFREKGFGGIGVSDLMKSAGLTHGGFYGQFESKDQLAAEAIAASLQKSVENWRQRAEDQPDDPFGALAGYYLSAKHTMHTSAGCPIATLASDTARQSDAVRASYTEGMLGLVGVLEEHVEGDTPEERREKTLAIFSNLVGAMVLARAVNDPDLSEEILASTRKHLGLGTKKARTAR